MKCITCKFWGNSRGMNEDSGDRRLKSCDCPKMHYGYHVREVEIPNDGAHIENDEGWGMTTGPHFGCVNYEHKESNK